MTSVLERLEALGEEATEGPWKPWGNPGEWDIIAADPKITVAECHSPEECQDADAALIAAARNALPDLLAAARALEQISHLDERADDDNLHGSLIARVALAPLLREAESE